MKNNKKQGRCPFSPLTPLATLLLIGGMLAIILPVLKWDAEVSAEAVEYEQLREQHQQAEARETAEGETQNQHAAPPVSLAEEGSAVQQSENAVGEQAAQVTVDLSAYLAQNPDFIAWLRIPGTNVVLVGGCGLQSAGAEHRRLWASPAQQRREDVHVAHAVQEPGFLRGQPNHCAGQPVPPQRIYDFCGREHEDR